MGTSAWVIHRVPEVWGQDADEFRPERMLDGGFESLPNQAWQPFGFGLRGCIGRPFAWQEAQLVLASAVSPYSYKNRQDNLSNLIYSCSYSS